MLEGYPQISEWYTPKVHTIVNLLDSFEDDYVLVLAALNLYLRCPDLVAKIDELRLFLDGYTLGKRYRKLCRCLMKYRLYEAREDFISTYAEGILSIMESIDEIKSEMPPEIEEEDDKPLN